MDNGGYGCTSEENDRPKRKPAHTFEFTPSTFQVPKQDITEQKVDKTFKFSWEKEVPPEAIVRPTASLPRSPPVYPPIPPSPTSPSGDGFKRVFERRILGLPVLAILLIGAVAGSAVGAYAYTQSTLFQSPSGCQALQINPNPTWIDNTGKEGPVTADSYAFVNNTDLIVYIRNSGGGSSPTAIDNVTVSNHGNALAVITAGYATDYGVMRMDAQHTLNVASSQSAWLYQAGTSGNATVTLTVRENSEVHICQYTIVYHPPSTPPPSSGSSGDVTFNTFYVTDSSANTCSVTNGWSAGPIAPGTVKAVDFNLNRCTWVGAAFQFTSGYSYTVKVVTTRNNQFTFTVTK